ncbi:MAG: hypothetical protein OHK0023_09290 [Anaerolineae bacterium]
MSRVGHYITNSVYTGVKYATLKSTEFRNLHEGDSPQCHNEQTLQQSFSLPGKALA